jgi:hypothetical protein
MLMLSRNRRSSWWRKLVQAGAAIGAAATNAICSAAGHRRPHNGKFVGLVGRCDSFQPVYKGRPTRVRLQRWCLPVECRLEGLGNVGDQLGMFGRRAGRRIPTIQDPNTLFICAHARVGKQIANKNMGGGRKNKMNV